MRGQSSSDFLWPRYFLVPAFIGTLSRQGGELRHKTYEAACYSAWEKVARGAALAIARVINIWHGKRAGYG